jgi:hypothetical protein
MDGTVRLERINRLSMWKNAGLAVLIAICLIALCEGAAWLADPERDDPPPGLGTYHRTFERNWRELSREVRKTGPVDCFFVGNSRVADGIDAEVVERVIDIGTGQTVDCYNMSTLGLTAPTIVVISEMLVTTYEPAVIIYGLTASDLPGVFDWEANEALANASWIRYWQGDPSLDGWLGHHSEAYGQVMGLVSWYRFVSNDWQHSHPELTDPSAGEELSLEEGLRDDIEEDLRLANLNPLELTAGNMAGLDQLIALREQGVTVILVEMPLYEGAWEPVFGGYDNYAEDFLQVMDAYAETNDVMFIHSTPFTLVDDDDWRDWAHLGESGRRVFSEWLGQQIVDGIAEGKIEFPAD